MKHQELTIFRVAVLIFTLIPAGWLYADSPARQQKPGTDRYADEQLQRAADAGVGAIAGSEQIDVTIHSDFVGRRSTHDQQWRRSPRARR